MIARIGRGAIAAACPLAHPPDRYAEPIASVSHPFSAAR